MKNQPRWIILLTVSIAWLFSCFSLSAAQTTQPSDSVDQSTQAMLKELQSVPQTRSAGNPIVSSAPSTEDALAPQTPAIDWWHLIRYDFPLMLITAAAVGVAGALLGLFVLLRREALVALAIPQVVAIGAALGMRLEWNNKLLPALGVALIALIYFARSKRWNAGNWIVPSFYVAGLCLSFLLIANHGQDVEDLQRMFTGVDVAVDRKTAAIAIPVLLVVGLVCALLWRRWLLLAQAPAAAELAGLRPTRWDALFLLLLTIVILLGTNALGVVMVLAMLFLPAATILPWTRRLPAAMLGGVILSLLFLVVGFYLSNTMNWPLSQSIGGAGCGALAISQIAAQFKG